MKNKKEMLGLSDTTKTRRGSFNTVEGGLRVKVPTYAPSEPKASVKIENLLKSVAAPTQLMQSPQMAGMSLPKVQSVASPAPSSQPQTMGTLPSYSSAIPMPAVQKNTQSVLPSQADVLRNTEAEIKRLNAEMQKKVQQKTSEKTLALLKPAFQNIESALKFQAKLNQKDKDFDSQQYNVPLSQSLFNLSANQISNMPSWRY